MSLPRDLAWKIALESQFAASLDMLERAIAACPPALWDDAATPVERRFGYLAYHTVFWLDCYTYGREEGYAPPVPFTLGEWDPAGVYPDPLYSRAQVEGFLAHARTRLRATLSVLDEAAASRPCGFPRHSMSVLELHSYNLRHVQHHVGQLQLLIRQAGGEPPRWVGRGQL